MSPSCSNQWPMRDSRSLMESSYRWPYEGFEARRREFDARVGLDDGDADVVRAGRPVEFARAHDEARALREQRREPPAVESVLRHQR